MVFWHISLIVLYIFGDRRLIILVDMSENPEKEKERLESRSLEVCVYFVYLLQLVVSIFFMEKPFPVFPV